MTPKEVADHAQAGEVLDDLGYKSEPCEACRGTGMQEIVMKIERIKKDGSGGGIFEQRNHCNFCGGTGKFWFLKAP